MILLRELFEAKPKTTDFSAISNETGKLVYFSTKDTMDAAVKAGTHAKPKTDKKQDYFDKIQKYLKTKDLFKGDYSKKRNTKVKVPIQSPNVTILSRKVDDIDNLYKHMVDSWASKKEKNVVKIEKATIKKQGEWVKKLITDKVIPIDLYNKTMEAWQHSMDKNALGNIDELLKNIPPPPIETKEPVYRGMIVPKKDYLKILEDFNNKKNVKLPIGSFTTFLDTATQFANPKSHPVADENHKNYSVVFRVKSECDKLNGFSMNSNIVSKKIRNTVKEFSDEHEVLMASNQKYKVDKINYVKFSDEFSPAKSMTFIDLVQKCAKNEGVDDDLDFTKDEFYKNLLQTNMRLDKKGD
jgi:hypothetical protein